MAKTLRTQAMRALDARKISYQVYVFPDTIHVSDLLAVTGARTIAATKPKE
jgi:hypothetical protein